MQTCTNCGATLRPGAKFCTTCGTRMNEMPATNDAYASWGTPVADAETDSQETSVFTAVQPPTPPPADAGSIRGGKQRSMDSWTSAYGNAKSPAAPGPDDPASRFISALDEDVKPTADAEPVANSAPASTWGTPAASFTPPPPSNWSYSGSETESTIDSADDVIEADVAPAEAAIESESGSADNVMEIESTPDQETVESSTWEPATTWSAPEPPEEDTSEPMVTDAAGFTEDGDDEVDYLSGDENIEVSGAPNPILPPEEARDKAIALVDELRRMVRMMSSGGESDHGAAAMALTEASLNVGDFSDLRGVLVDVKNDPRDIQALSSLAAKVDRIEVLIEEHASLVDTIERAIPELNG